MSQPNLSREEGIVNKFKSRFPESVKETKIDRARRITITCDKDHILEIAKFTRDEIAFDHIIGISGVDFPTHKKLEVLHFLGSVTNPDMHGIILILKTDLPKENPSIASVVSVWESAHFHERETFEMFGINFEGHPDLRKLLTLDNWEGPPPMLKDLKFPEMSQR